MPRSWSISSTCRNDSGKRTYIKRGTQAFSNHVGSQLTRDMSQQCLKKIRDLWPYKLVIKGTLSLADAHAAVKLGADGVIVSTHGGRQLDSTPASIEVLPAIRQAVGDKLTVMLDGGVRTGSDIVKTYCTGADYVFSRRAFIYGMAAAGPPGVARALEILKVETSTALALLGCTDIAELDKTYLKE